MTEKSRGDKLIGVCYAALIFSPLVVILIQSLIHGMNLFLAVPTWSDELDYFREVFSFSHNGFNFGGSMFAGYEAAVGPLGAHSVSPRIAWGPFSLLGWNEHSILFYNIIFLCFSIAVYLLCVQPRGLKLALSFAVVCFYAPLNLYMYTSMMEVMIYGWVIIYFSLFARYLVKRNGASFAAALATGIVVCLLRMPYVVLLFPLIWAASDFKFNLKTLKNLIIYIILFLVVYKVYNLFCSDYPDWVTSKLKMQAGLLGKLKFIFYNTKMNLKLYFTVSASPVQVAMRYAYGFAILALLAASFFEIKDGAVKKCFKRGWFSLFVMTGGLWAIMITLYDIKAYRDFRTFAPVLFFVILFVIVDDETRGLKIACLAFIALVGVFSFKEGLTADRKIVWKAETDSSVAVLKEDAGDEVKSVGATWDINWGDVELLKSIPSRLGYKVFLENVDKDLSTVDYVLTTRQYIDGHEDLESRLEFMFETKDSYLIYKVK